MSVTFFAVNAPSIPSAIYDNRDRSYSYDGPEFLVSESTPFELNVSQFNYRKVLKILGIPEGEEDYVGTIKVDDLSKHLDEVQAYEDSLGNNYKPQIEELVLYCMHINSDLSWG